MSYESLDDLISSLTSRKSIEVTKKDSRFKFRPCFVNKMFLLSSGDIFLWNLEQQKK